MNIDMNNTKPDIISNWMTWKNIKPNNETPALYGKFISFIIF